MSSAPSTSSSAAARRRRHQLACVNAFWVFLVLFGFGWFVLAGFAPPPSPADSADQIAQMFRDDTDRIRVGMVISIFSAALLLPWGGAICGQLRRIDGRRSVWLWAWVMAQACLVIEFMYPCAFWGVAAFRPENAFRVQLLNDLAWLPFLSIVSTVMFQAVALGVLTLGDERASPVFPRWFGYFQLWCAVGVVPGGFIYLFKTGPLAWDGVLAFWVSIVAGFAWMALTTLMTARAIKAEPDITLAPAGEDAIERRLATVEAELARLMSASDVGR